MAEVAAFERFSLSGRRALITGGSIGMGGAIAMAFAEAGADVAIQYSPAADTAVARDGAAKELCAGMTALGRLSHAIPADFVTPGAARHCIEAAELALGGIDILVICASVQEREDFAQIAASAVARQISINFAAVIEQLQAVLPGMASRGWGRVLSIGSVNHLRPDPELAVYAACKAAQHNLIMNLAATHAPLGVTLNTLSPGLIATDRNASRRRDPVLWSQIAAAANPMARAGVPEDVVGAALLLCSPASAFITGIDLPVAGGAQL